jgi:large subunit ribosomal protein L16
MLRPRKTKYKKYRKGRLKNNLENKSNKLKFGTIGLQATERGFITANQIEAGRRTITGFMKRTGKVFIRAFPDHPITSKPAEVRMGKGKGSVSYWVCKVKSGKILYEVAGKNPILIKQALQQVSNKLPMSTKIII